MQNNQSLLSLTTNFEFLTNMQSADRIEILFLRIIFSKALG